jgi:hypothetical protein
MSEAQSVGVGTSPSRVSVALAETWRADPKRMKADLDAATDALWDNAFDGRYADRCMDSDFDTAWRRLRASFVRHLSGAA